MRMTTTMADKRNYTQEALDKFTEMMITRMEQMKSSRWKQGWIGKDSAVGAMPQNVSGRNYSGSNSFFLQLDSAMRGYKMPVYLTYTQTTYYGAHVKEGEKSVPVFYWDLLMLDKDGHRIKEKDLDKMTEEEMKGVQKVPLLKSFSVFNLDQTTFAQQQPKLFAKLQEVFKAQTLRDTEGMFTSKALDRMFERQEWLCPIQYDKIESSAYYSKSRDSIVVPSKKQFNIGKTPEEVYKDGMEYYSSAIHEMAHSTGHPSRLNRLEKDKFGDAKYAKEELVAELTAAMVGNAMGFDKRILDNNAAYLDGWIRILKEEPKFIVSVMADVNKASNIILEEVDKQKMAIGERPLLGKNQKAFRDEYVHVDFDSASIVKKKNGDYAIRASYKGEDLGMKDIPKPTGKLYMSLTDSVEKLALLQNTFKRYYSKELKQGVEKKESRSLSL